MSKIITNQEPPNNRELRNWERAAEKWVNVEISGRMLRLIAEVRRQRKRFHEDGWKLNYAARECRARDKRIEQQAKEIEQLKTSVMDARFVLCMEREGYNFEDDVCLGCGINRHDLPRNDGGPQP